MALNYVADLGTELARIGRGGESKGQIKWQKSEADRQRKAGKQAEEGWRDGWMDGRMEENNGWIDGWMHGDELCGHDVDGLPHVRQPTLLLVSWRSPATCRLPVHDDCRCYKYRPLACASTYPTTTIITLNILFNVFYYLLLYNSFKCLLYYFIILFNNFTWWACTSIIIKRCRNVWISNSKCTSTYVISVYLANIYTNNKRI